MSTRRTPPTVRARQLALALRRLRQDTTLSGDDVAAQLGWSQSKVSRIESGATSAAPADVAVMLDLYGVTSPDRDALINLARDAKRRGWWTAFSDEFSGSFVALEDEASTITTWQPLLIPGLLQTEEYARAVIGAGIAGDPDRVHRRVSARLQRRRLLTRPHPPTLHAIIGEAALRQQVGGADVMREQVSDLWDHSCKGHVTIQIVEFAAGASRGLEGPCTLFTFAPDQDLDVAYAEGQGGPVYLESERDVAEIKLTLDSMLGAALSPADSQSLLADIIERE